ncbi:MAG TPA: hypothetical protein V6C46_07015, partial [Coleofasciculaceae cyanobacterium]
NSATSNPLVGYNPELVGAEPSQTEGSIFQGTAGDDNLSAADQPDLILVGTGDDRITAGGGTDIVYAGNGTDWINGGPDNDLMFGEAGNDLLVGDAGADTLVGGSGRDLFVLAPGSGPDTIADFEDGVDLLALSEGLSFSQLTIVDGTGGQNGSALIRITSTGELLASLTGISANTITTADFIPVG